VRGAEVDGGDNGVHVADCTYHHRGVPESRLECGCCGHGGPRLRSLTPSLSPARERGRETWRVVGA
jgi:hypothetical protein